MSAGLSIEEIYKRRGSFANFMVVFVDVKSYSGRTARTQQEIVSVLTSCLNKALTKTTTEYRRYDRQHRNIDFLKGVVKIPTGDGAAIAFSYTGHPFIHLIFALYLLEEIQKSNGRAASDENKFHVRIGIAEDSGIIYKDINGNYNVAGRAINMASRVMDIADENQIMLTDRAYDNLTQVQKQFKGKFESYENIKIKNGSETVWQYTDKTKSCLNTESRPKVSSSMSLTQSDLENALSPMRKALEQITNKLDNRFIFLNSTNQIYDAVIEAINKAKRNIRIVRLGLRPAAPRDVLNAIKQKVSEGVTYDIVIVLDPSKPIGGFEESHESLRELFGGNKGADERYFPYVLRTSEPICFDTIIVDNTDVGIGFIHASGVEDLQDAIMFHNPDVAGTLVHWFENVIKRNPNTKSYYDWKKE
jgi:class 3 adenylate cyclase